MASTIQIIATTSVGTNTILHITTINITESKVYIDSSPIATFTTYKASTGASTTRVETLTVPLSRTTGMFLTNTGNVSYYLLTATATLTYKYGVANDVLYTNGYVETAIIYFTGVYTNTPKIYSTVTHGATIIITIYNNTTTTKVILDNKTVSTSTSNIPPLSTDAVTTATAKPIFVTLTTTVSSSDLPPTATQVSDGYYVAITEIEAVFSIEYFTTNGTEYSTAELHIPITLTYSYSVIAISINLENMSSIMETSIDTEVQTIVNKTTITVLYVAMAALTGVIVYSVGAGVLAGNPLLYKKRIFLAAIGIIIIYLLPRILDWIAGI